MTNVKLSEKHSVRINTMMEKHVLMMLLCNNKFSSVKIDNTCIYLQSDSEGRPEVVYTTNFTTSKAKVNIIGSEPDDIESDVWVDVNSVVQQLFNADLSDSEDGSFAYIDWDKKFITISTNLSEVNSGIRFRLDDIPALKSENTEICNAMNPKIENMGLQGNDIFQALITSRIIKAKILVDINNPLNTYVIEV